MWHIHVSLRLSTAYPCKSIYDLHVRTIPCYIADFFACFAVRSADWSEEMAPKRRVSEKKLQAFLTNRLNRWHDSASSHGGIDAVRDDDDDDKERA